MLAFISYLVIGSLAGLASGMFGVGGGAVVVPLLALVFHQQGMPEQVIMHIAEGTSFASMIVTTLFSLRAHRKRGVEVWPTYKRLAVGIIIGTVLGALLADGLKSDILQIIFGLFMLLVATRMFIREQPAPHRDLPGPLASNGIAALIGAKSGLLGIGGGSLSVPFLVYCNVPMRSAVGISTAWGVTIAIVGTISYILTGLNEVGLPAGCTGHVYWPAVLGILLASPLFATYGAHLSHKLPVTHLKRLFGIFLAVVGLRMLGFF